SHWDALVKHVGYTEQQVVQLRAQPVRLRREALGCVSQLPGPCKQRWVVRLRELPRQHVLLRSGRFGTRSRLAPALVDPQYLVDGRRLTFELGRPLDLVRTLSNEVQGEHLLRASPSSVGTRSRRGSLPGLSAASQGGRFRCPGHRPAASRTPGPA